MRKSTLFTLTMGKRQSRQKNVTSKKQALSSKPVILCLWLSMMIICSLMNRAKILEHLSEKACFFKAYTMHQHPGSPVVWKNVRQSEW
jgi:hypothetical protein